MAVVRPIYIEKNEGVGSVVSRVREAGDKNIAVVFPPNSSIFNNLVEVKFLKEEIDKLRKNVIVVTPDEDQEEMAEGVGFKVKKDLEDDFQDEFLESFYSKGSKKSKKEKKESTLEPSKGSAQAKKKPAALKKEKKEAQSSNSEAKKRLQVSDIVSPGQKSASSPKQRSESEEKSKRGPIGEDKKKEKKPSSPQKKESGKGSDSLFSSLFLGSATKVLGWIFFVSFIALALTVTFVFPRAQVEVAPPQAEKEISSPISIDRALASPDLKNDLIPGEIFTVEKELTKNFPSSGTEDAVQKATGTIKIYNRYSSEDQPLTATTRFLSEEGKLFRIPESIVVPGASVDNGELKPNYIETTVAADEAGEEYNIGPTRFSIPGFEGTDKEDGFYAISEESMKGGKEGRVSVVTEEDKEEATKKVKQEFFKQAKEELSSQLPKDLELIESTLDPNIGEPELSPQVGGYKEEFTVILEGEPRAFAFRPAYVETIVKDKIKDEISDQEIILEDTLVLGYSAPDLDFEEGEAELQVEAEVKTSWDVDKEKLKEVLAGKGEAESRKALSGFREVETLRVKLWPFWLQRIPKDQSKIDLEIIY